MDLLRRYFLASSPTVVTNEEFFERLKRNSSIRTLSLAHCDRSDPTGRVGDEIWNAANSHGIFLAPEDLTHVCLEGGSRLRASTVKSHADIDTFLNRLLEAIRGKTLLTRLELIGIGIGRNGCESIARLLQDPECYIVSLNLAHDSIDDECALVLADGLMSNNRLETLTFPTRNAMTRKGWGAFSKALCNTASLNDTYNSNHTIKYLGNQLSPGHRNFSFLFDDDAHKKQVAIKKILRHHLHFDMEPFFEWEYKMLPATITWFGRARSYAENGKLIDARKLDAIYQFLTRNARGL